MKSTLSKKNKNFALALILFCLFFGLGLFWAGISFQNDSFRVTLKENDGKLSAGVASIDLSLKDKAGENVVFSTEDEERFQKAIKLFNRGELKKANNDFEALRIYSGRRPFILYFLGYTNRRLGKVQRAANDYLDYLKKAPKSSYREFALAELLFVYCKLGQGAELRGEELLDSLKDTVDFRQKNLAEAIALLFFRRGDQMRRAKNHRAAEQYFLKSMESRPTRECLLNLVASDLSWVKGLKSLGEIQTIPQVFEKLNSTVEKYRDVVSITEMEKIKVGINSVRNNL